MHICIYVSVSHVMNIDPTWVPLYKPDSVYTHMHTRTCIYTYSHVHTHSLVVYICIICIYVYTYSHVNTHSQVVYICIICIYVLYVLYVYVFMTRDTML